MLRRLSALGSVLIVLAACTAAPKGATVTSPTSIYESVPRLAGHSLVYNPNARQIVLFGETQSDYKPSIWTWDGRGWTVRPQTLSPPGFVGESLAYDGFAVILLGAGNADIPTQTWQRKNGAWIQLHPTSSPPPAYTFSVVGDQAAGGVLAFGGCCAQTIAPSQTWRWDGQTWTQLHPASMPSDRIDPALVYDPAIGHVVLFGGYVAGSGSGSNDLWIWDGRTWLLQHPKTTPPAELANFAVGYDGRNKTLLLLARVGKYDVETWTWDGDDWTRRYPSITVPTTVAYSMAWDEATQQLVLFDEVSVVAPQTYVWTGTDWQRMA